MSLRTKLVVWLATLSVIASAVVGLLSYNATSRQLHGEIDASLRAAAVPATGPVGGPRVRPLAPRRAVPGIDVQYLDRSGDTVVASGSTAIPVDRIDERLAEAEDRGVGRFRDVGDDPAAQRVFTVSLGGGRGAIQSARNLEETNRVLASLRWRILVVSLAVAAGGAVVGVVVGGSVTRRLVRLSRATEQVGSSGDLGVRVPEEGGDEVAGLGASFNSMLATLEGSVAEQQRLVQDAGHELRTPMTSLRTNLFTLRNFAELDEPTRRAVVADLESEAEELSSLVEEVLQVAERSTAAEVSAPFDLGDLVRAEATRTAARWNRPVELHRVQDLNVVASRSGIARVVRNLVDNACKFSSGGSAIEVTLRPAEGAGGAPGVLLEVLDQGVGFEPGEEQTVFARFRRSDAARSLPGSGLGLSIVDEVVRSHDGWVRASNRDGGGALVALWLPVSGGHA